MTRQTWTVIGGFVTFLGVVQGCSAPTIPGHDDLVLGADGNARKSKSGTDEDAPEGTTQGSIELGQDTKSSEPPPDADRTKGDDGANDAPAQCTTDAQCNQSGRICTAGTCVQGCRTDAGCSANESCTAGQCELGDASVECTADYNRDYGSICIAAKCIDGCYTSYDCPIGQGCSAGKCTVTMTSAPAPSDTSGSGTSCTSDGQCNPGLDGSGQICSPQGTCIAGCHRDNQCPGVKICVTGVCR